MGLVRTDTSVLQSLRDGLIQTRNRSDEALKLAEAEVSKTLNQLQEDIHYWEQVFSRCRDQSCRDAAQSKLQFLHEYVRRVEADVQKVGSSERAFMHCIDASIQTLTELVAVLERYLQLNRTRALLNQGVNANLVTQLINNKADLGDIVVNVQILLDGGIRVDLVNGWLGNGTHLNDAIAIVNQGIDLNLIGTSRKVGDFTGLTGATPNEVISRISKNAVIRHWVSELGRIEKGMRFAWKDASGKPWMVRMHEADPQAPAGSSAARGWVLRVAYGNKFMDAGGNLYTENALKNAASSNYHPDNANNTHIPIQAP